MPAINRIHVSCYCILAVLPFQNSVAQETATTTETAPASANEFADVQAQQAIVKKHEQKSRDKWEDEIQRLEARNARETHPDDSILLIGSSSIRLWKTAQQDIAPYASIQRGYGGAKYSDMAVFAERIVTPHRFQAVVMFVANDISGSENDHTPEEVGLLVQNILGTIRKHAAEQPVLIVEITPCSSRFKVWHRIRQANAVLRQICLTNPNTYFVETAEHYLDNQKQPIDSLFVDDKLHLNEQGYAQWGQLIRRELDEVLKP